ncbi:MAG: hypothetical protein QUU85_03090, partial [Candidatus Eisenbacteria bacterium]|nr:hypothetical protein [Candidatus Eisenbacteria bacterium]
MRRVDGRGTSCDFRRSGGAALLRPAGVCLLLAVLSSSAQGQESSPAEAAPVESAQVESAQVESAPVESAPAEPASVEPSPACLLY